MIALSVISQVIFGLILGEPQANAYLGFCFMALDETPTRLGSGEWGESSKPKSKLGSVMCAKQRTFGGMRDAGTATSGILPIMLRLPREQAFGVQGTERFLRIDWAGTGRSLERNREERNTREAAY
jgi:hypothetical protein